MLQPQMDYQSKRGIILLSVSLILFTLLVNTIPNQSLFWSLDNMPVPLAPGIDGWKMVSIPGFDTVAKTDLLFLHNGTYYTWLQATTNDNEEGTPLIVNFIYGWDYDLGNYNIAEEMSPYLGYWIFLYFDDIVVYGAIPGSTSTEKTIVAIPGTNIIC